MSREDNVVYIGRKPVMSYVLAVMTHFNRTDSNEIVLKARGRSITTAVDVAEITRRRFMDKLKVSNISIDTENIVELETNRTRAVSTIEITLLISEEEQGTFAGKEKIEAKTTDLTSIQGIGSKHSEKLKIAGIMSAEDLSQYSVEDLVEKMEISEKNANKWIQNAKEIIAEKDD